MSTPAPSGVLFLWMDHLMKQLVLIAVLTLLSAGAVVRVATPVARANDPAAEGREIFNQYCYHCHGTDAVQGERPRDLRRLTKRYGDDRYNVFIRTVHEGRPDKGMPSWQGVIDDATFEKIWAFLLSVQTN